MDKPTTEGLARLVKKKVSPDELLKRFRQSPIVNTFGDEPAIILEMINLIPAPGKEEYFRYFENGDNAIYWKSSETDLGVEIVGVVWDVEENQKVMCGIILPP